MAQFQVSGPSGGHARLCSLCARAGGRFPKVQASTSSKMRPCQRTVMQSLWVGLILRNEKLPRDHLTHNCFNGYLPILYA